jgi:hypothetical protein
MRKFPTTREQVAYEMGVADAAKKDGEPLTMEKIKAMSQEEVAARLPEVNEVLANGDPVESQS